MTVKQLMGLYIVQVRKTRLLRVPATNHIYLHLIFYTNSYKFFFIL
jgi:hypothetical protein